jgi:hypothetical protein
VLFLPLATQLAGASKSLNPEVIEESLAP